MKTILCLITLCLLAGRAVGFSPATPWRHVVTSEDKFFFVMDPGNFADVPGKGVAYKAKRNGIEKIWEVKGWYAPPGDVFLSYDGKTLVRMVSGVPFLSDETTLPKEDVLFFYRKGKLKRSYKVSELLKDLEKGMRLQMFGFPKRYWVADAKIAPSMLHHVEEITKDETTISHHPDVFQLSTIEGNLILFDLKTGAILTKKVIPKEESKVDDSDGDPFADDNFSEDGKPVKKKTDREGGTDQPTNASKSKF